MGSRTSLPAFLQIGQLIPMNGPLDQQNAGGTSVNLGLGHIFALRLHAPACCGAVHFEHTRPRSHRTYSHGLRSGPCITTDVI